jgi:iron complex transport system substrate-binding protein
VSRSLDAVNALALLVALGLSSVGASFGGPRAAPRISGPREARPAIERTAMPNGRPALRDAQGTLVPLVDYRRIASATLLADRALLELCERDRIVAFTRYAQRTADAHRYRGTPAISARDPLERILALKPDLLLVSELFDAAYAARLREQGIAVFDLGAMAGFASLLRAVEVLGVLTGAPERAASYAAALTRRMRAVARDGETLRPARTLYLAAYGERLFGGAADTSFHDVIVHAGLRDAAAEAGLVGWPELSPERLLILDPEVVLTHTGMGAVICRLPAMFRLAPCRGEGRLIELPQALLDDPGPGMIEAAEALRDAALRP